ncbi:MAG: glycoside hydrolase family 71/99 protein, partial [Thermoguttaceae bacterium]
MSTPLQVTLRFRRTDVILSVLPSLVRFGGWHLFLRIVPFLLASSTFAGEAKNTWDAASEFRTWMRDAEAARPVSAADYVPPPQPVSSSPYQVGVFMCPLWKTGTINGREWDAILPFPKRQPLLGWYDEGDPEVTDWEIKYLLEHGVTFGITCWYREKGNAGQPVKPWLGHWLHDGLFKSRYGDRFQFAILWENLGKRAEGSTSEQDLLENLLPFWVENYFQRPNYLKVGGKPLLMIYGVPRFIEDMKGEAGAKAAIAKMGEYCRGRGLGGLTILGEYHQKFPNRLPALSAIGLDGVASYHWPSFSGLLPPQPDPGKLIEAQELCWRELAKATVPGPVTVSVGWDSRPWNKAEKSSRQWQLAPPHFAELCRRARAY